MSMQTSFSSIESNPPADNIAEISLFGPGVGECIVLHLGEGRWFIIDSCLNPNTKEPVALEYLISLNVDVSSKVDGILITHWHKDHIAGVSKLLEVCVNARLFCSNALMSREAFYIAGLYKKDIFSDTDKEIREFGQVIKFLRKTNASHRLVPVKIRHTFYDTRDDISVRLVALSPSNVAVTQSISKLRQIKPNAGDDRVRNIVPESENLNAVAIHFTFGDFTTILGSDLEEKGNPQTGWSAIFSDNIINDLSLPVASLFKVAHHGSETGYHDRVWRDLLIEKPFSMTTPYTPSKLPTSSSIEKLQNLSSDFLITRDPKSNKKVRRENMVEKVMRSVSKKRTIINDKMGHIQVRISDKGIKTISVNEHVVKLKI